MKHRLRGIIPVFLMWLGLALAVAAPVSLGQKSRSYTRNEKTGMYRWADWKALPCERCESKAKTACGTCNAGRKKLPVKCGECRGKKKSNCRECFGNGNYIDPFLTVQCDRCEGRGAITCFQCGANGTIMYNNGKKGAKCKVCSKKGYLKCWTCKGKGHLDLMQPEGAGYAQATEAQLKAVQSKLTPVFSKLDAFTGLRQTEKQDKNRPPEKEKTIFRENDYEDAMKAMAAIFPQFKTDIKKTNSMGQKSLKHKELKDYTKQSGKMRQRSASAAQYFLNRHLNIIKNSLEIFDRNRRQEEMNRRRKKKVGGAGG
ncbi:MAG: hypothetical protein ACI97A_000153 [Planctomycetota bacterium]|jgi:hypothetical protein